MENEKFNPADLGKTVGASDLTVGEVITSFRQAKDRRAQLGILAEQTLLPEEKIKDLLLSHGVSYKEFPRAPRKKNPAEIRPDPTPAPAAKPARKTETSPPPPEKFTCRGSACAEFAAA